MNQQISNTRYEYYVNTFTSTAEAGIKSSQALYVAINPISRARFSSFEVKRDALNATNALAGAIASSYEIIFADAHSVHPMREAFRDLADHIRQWTGKTLDQYLADEGISVSNTYAKISNVVDEEISSGSIT